MQKNQQRFLVLDTIFLKPIFFTTYQSKAKNSLHFVKKRFVSSPWVHSNNTASAFDIRFYLTPLRQARQFIETRGT
jgi:hypothetical protein